MSSLVRLLRFTKNLAPYYAIVGASSVAVALAGIAGPFVIGSAADTIVSAVRSGQEAAAWKVVWLAAAFFAVDLLSTAAVLAISAICSPWLAVLLFLVFPVCLTMLTSKGWQVYETQKNEKTGRASGRFMEVIGRIKAVKSFVQELRELTGFASLFGETVTLTERQSRRWHTMDFIRRSFMGLMFFAVYAIIFVNTARGSFSVGDMVVLVQLVAMARQPIANLSWIVDTSQRAVAGSRDFFAVMEKMNDARPAVEGEIAEAEKAGALAKPVREYAAVRPLTGGDGADATENAEEPAGTDACAADAEAGGAGPAA